MDRRVVGAAAAILFIASVVTLAVRADQREDPGVSLMTSSPRPVPEQEGVELSPEVQDRVDDIPHATMPTIPPPVEPPPSLRMPEPEEIEVPVRPPVLVAPVTPPSPKPAPAPPRNGSDCGTPSGYGGYGADRSKTVGTTKITIQIYSCHQYDGDYLQNFVIVEDPKAWVLDVNMDYGDGQTYDDNGYAWSCDDDGRPNPYYFTGPIHTYANEGRYDVTATVTWAQCNADGTAGAQQTTKVSIPVFRHAGPRPS